MKCGLYTKMSAFIQITIKYGKERLPLHQKDSQFVAGAVLAHKILGWHCPICPFITESIFSILRNQKNTNFIYAYIFCQLCNGRPIETRHKGPRAEVGFFAGDSEPLTSAEGSGSAVSSPSGVRSGVPENLDFRAFWDLRNHVRMVS